MQFQHIIPKFILKNYSIYSEIINVYDVSMGYIHRSNILSQYGAFNMYNDFLYNSISIKSGLSVLECRSANLIRHLLSRDTVTLDRSEVIDFVRFLYVMQYRNEKKKLQYMNEDFDHSTLISIKQHMKYCKIKNIHDVWFHDLRWFTYSTIREINHVLDNYQPNEYSRNTVVYKIELSDF
ncbi:unnamed protein product [Cunninghamella blakesleeana]